MLLGGFAWRRRRPLAFRPAALLWAPQFARSLEENAMQPSEASPARAPRSPHVVVVGAGFGGLEVAKRLGKAGIAVTVIDRHNHHLFQPLLYQVATAALSAPEIAEPIRRILRRQASVEVVFGEVVGIDVAAKTVSLTDGQTIGYDYLVLAAGARSSYFGHDDWPPHAPGSRPSRMRGASVPSCCWPSSAPSARPIRSSSAA
jgi:NADPH-dependent 2,4-dienoyl-CoA reductase/sulfur reductase-like enzyme